MLNPAERLETLSESPEFRQDERILSEMQFLVDLNRILSRASTISFLVV
jgi:hypothetical protein